MRIAIPKGRLQDRALGVFAEAGYTVPDDADLKTRKLVFDRGGIEWIFVKDGDVPVYVEHGAADAGIAGLDQILEHECTAYQPVELPFGHCRMMLIAAPGAPPLTKVATKYPRITRHFLESRGIRAEIVPLSGSVELALSPEKASRLARELSAQVGERVGAPQIQTMARVAQIRDPGVLGFVEKFLNLALGCWSLRDSPHCIGRLARGLPEPSWRRVRQTFPLSLR